MPPAPRRSTLAIDDPRVLRALAHPARQRVISELYGGEVLTATEAGRLCGLTPSAMSYHLRALEKWGIVLRDVSGDGRERPWRAAAEDLWIGPQAYIGAGAVVGDDLVATWGGRIGEALARAATRLKDADPQREGDLLFTVKSSRLWLTPEEAHGLDAGLAHLLEPFADRSSRRHPQDALARDAYWLVLPTEEPPAPG